MSQLTVMDPLGGPGEAAGLRRLRYLIVTAPDVTGAYVDPELPTAEQAVINELNRWLFEPGLYVLAVPHGTVILALDPDTGACVWSTGSVPGAAAEEIHGGKGAGA